MLVLLALAFITVRFLEAPTRLSWADALFDVIR